jgi:hypothetical protein
MLDAPSDPLDRQIPSCLFGTPQCCAYGEAVSAFYPSGSALDELLPLICRTDRCVSRRSALPGGANRWAGSRRQGALLGIAHNALDVAHAAVTRALQKFITRRE